MHDHVNVHVDVHVLVDVIGFFAARVVSFAGASDRHCLALRNGRSLQAVQGIGGDSGRERLAVETLDAAGPQLINPPRYQFFEF